MDSEIVDSKATGISLRFWPPSRSFLSTTLSFYDPCHFKLREDIEREQNTVLLVSVRALLGEA